MSEVFSCLDRRSGERVTETGARRVGARATFAAWEYLAISEEAE